MNIEAAGAAGAAHTLGLNWIDWLIVVLYLGGMIGMSMWLGRKQESVEDYYLGGNNLPWWAIGISTMATQCSSNSFLGTPAFVALGVGGGLVYLQSELALPLAMIFIIMLLLPFFRRARVISVYEYLELRFGVITRTALSCIFQLGRALGTGVTVYSVSMVLEVALGIPLWVSILTVGVVTVIYDTLGGMEAVVYSDVIQMLVLYGSALYLMLWSIGQVGGFGELLRFWSGSPLTVGDSTIELAQRFKVLHLHEFGFDKGEEFAFWPCLIGFFFLYMSYYGCDQSQVQRELSSRDIDDTNLSLFLNGILRFFLTGTMCLMGLAIGAVLFKDLATNRPFLEKVLADPSRQNQMLMYFVLTYMPHGLIGLVVVAIFAAAMSSLDSAINSISATTMRDIYERFVNPMPVPDGNESGKEGSGASGATEATVDDEELARWEAGQLKWSRRLTIFWGAFCTFAAFATPYLGSNVVIVVNKIGSLTYGPILGVFLLAILTVRVTDLGALAGLLTGVAFDVYLWVGTDISWLWWNVFGCLVTVMVGYLSSLLDRPMDVERVKEYVWSPGSYDSFGYKRNWKAYCVALVAVFFAYLVVCRAIESIPALYAVR